MIPIAMTTEFRPPYIHDAVLRPRLFQILEENSHYHNFLVTGQAAQGKSTLLASYLHHAGGKAVWLHLSKEDTDPSKLFERLTQAIYSHHRIDGVPEEASVPDSTLGTGKGVLRYVERILQTLKTLSGPLILVLDDVEVLDEASSGFQLIQGVLTHGSDNLKIFLLSRNISAFHLPRLKMEHKLFILGNEDLAFTLEETRLFFSGKVQIQDSDMERIHRITGGWVGGLTLVSESLRQFKDLKNLPDRLTSDLFYFFSQEIYNRLPETIQAFLMKAAVLDIIDLKVVNQVLDAPDALNILTTLEQRNLFIQRVDPDMTWPKFKFHTLFREFLHQDLLKTKGRAAYQTLCRKIGLFFWDNKDHEQALKYLVRAGAVPEMVRIIRIKGTDYIINGKMSRLETWLRDIPEKVIHSDPWLIFLGTMTRRIKGGKRNIRDFKAAFDLFEQARDIRGMLLSIGFLIEAAVFIREPSGMILSWIQRGEAQLRHIQGKDRYPWARALLWQQMGLGYIAGDGNIPKGVSACRNAMLLGRQINNPALVLHAAITLTFGYVQAGDFVNARQMLAFIKEMTKEGPYPEYRALKNIVDIDFSLKNGRFEEAGELLFQSEADIEKFGLIFLYPAFIEAKALTMVYTGQYDEAKNLADHLNDFSILEGNDFYRGISHRIKALSFLREKKYQAAETQINQALNTLDPARKGDIHHFLALQLSGMILFQNHYLVEAKNALVPALDYFEQISSDLSCAETCFMLGLISWDLKESEAAQTYLLRGFEKASKEGYLFFPLMDKACLLKTIVLTTLAFQGSIPRDDYALALVGSQDRGRVFDHMDEILALAKKKDKIRYIEALRPLYKKLLPSIRIETLGQFQILVDHRPLDPGEFEGARPVLLLKSIVLHGSRDIPKEVLIDDLWPHATANAGEKNFKVNFHRLRKVMEPFSKKEFGYVCIVQKSGLISLDPDLVTLDSNEFMALGAMAAEHEKNNQPEAALDLYDRAQGLYKGDYFCEEPYVEWILRKRELFRARFMAYLQKKAVLLEELGQMDRAVETWQRILVAEPYYEPAFQNLMILYADSGRRQKAIQVFETCRDLLKRELGSEPDRETLDIWRQIKAH